MEPQLLQQSIPMFPYQRFQGWPIDLLLQLFRDFIRNLFPTGVLQGAFFPVYGHLGLRPVTSELKINDLILLTFVLFIYSISIVT